MKGSQLTVTDQFCGAGGSSQGAREALAHLGGSVRLAMNHWKLAIETHNHNFPEAMHDCTDISACDPRRYPSTNILLTSPECTNHSLAKGQKVVKKQMDLFEKGVLDAAAERSRATMWDVVRFAEYHKYEGIIVENVVDARKWILFDSWLLAMRNLGYEHKAVYINSMHFHPTPQSRDRMYIVFWKKGNKAPDLEYRPKAYCPCCAKDVDSFQHWKRPDIRAGKYRQQYVYKCPVDGTTVEPYYYAAFNAIDWSDVGTKISDRKTALSDNTIRRIKIGLEKYGSRPAIVTTRYTSGNDFRVKDAMNDVIPTQPGDNSHAVLTPFILKAEHSNVDNVRGAMQPFQTQTTRQSMGLVVPYIVEMNKTGKMKPAESSPASTLTAGGINHALVVSNYSPGYTKPVTDALGTVTTADHHGLLTSEAVQAFIHYNYGNTTLSGIEDPLGTATTKDRYSLISYPQPRLEDCSYRMLKPKEVKAAMAFEKDYIIIGNARDQVRQLGNAVTPPAMKWLVTQLANTLI